MSPITALLSAAPLPFLAPLCSVGDALRLLWRIVLRSRAAREPYKPINTAGSGFRGRASEAQSVPAETRGRERAGQKAERRLFAMRAPFEHVFWCLKKTLAIAV